MEGRGPVRKFPCSCRVTNRERVKTEGGITPRKELVLTTRLTRAVILLKVVGKVPVSLFVDKYRFCSRGS